MGQILLITGGSGFLGWNLCRQATAAGYEVWTTCHQHTIEVPGTQSVQCDLTDPAAVSALLGSAPFAGVLHAAAAAKPDFCQEHVRRAWRINVEATGRLAAAAASRKIPFVFTSTDLVFSGRGSLYPESAPADPISVYGEQKVEAERIALARHPGAAVCRLPTMFGFGTPFSGSFLTPMLQRLRAGESVPLFVDEYRSFASGESVAAGLLLALRDRWQGIWHLAGPERLSRFEFGQAVCDAFGFPLSLLQAGRQQQVQTPAPRARDVSLDISKAQAAGYRPGSVREELAKLAAR